MAVYQEWGATTLPNESASKIGTFNFEHTSLNVNDPNYWNVSGTFPVIVYATSVVSTAFSVSTWNNVAYGSFYCVYSPTDKKQESMNIDDVKFNGAKSIAITLGPSTGSYIQVSLYPISLVYSTSDWVVLDSGDSMGRYAVLALDGGISG